MPWHDNSGWTMPQQAWQAHRSWATHLGSGQTKEQRINGASNASPQCSCLHTMRTHTRHDGRSCSRRCAAHPPASLKNMFPTKAAKLLCRQQPQKSHKLLQTCRARRATIEDGSSTKNTSAWRAKFVVARSSAHVCGYLAVSSQQPGDQDRCAECVPLLRKPKCWSLNAYHACNRRRLTTQQCWSTGTGAASGCADSG